MFCPFGFRVQCAAIMMQLGWGAGDRQDAQRCVDAGKGAEKPYSRESPIHRRGFSPCCSRRKVVFFRSGAAFRWPISKLSILFTCGGLTEPVVTSTAFNSCSAGKQHGPRPTSQYLSIAVTALDFMKKIIIQTSITTPATHTFLIPSAGTALFGVGDGTRVRNSKCVL